jgi:hypothetical protein
MKTLIAFGGLLISTLGPVIQNMISANPGLKLTRCFSLCISARLFIPKLQRRRLLVLIQTKFLKKYLQIYKHTGSLL